MGGDDCNDETQLITLSFTSVVDKNDDCGIELNIFELFLHNLARCLMGTFIFFITVIILPDATRGIAFPCLFEQVFVPWNSSKSRGRPPPESGPAPGVVLPALLPGSDGAEACVIRIKSIMIIRSLQHQKISLKSYKICVV